MPKLLRKTGNKHQPAMKNETETNQSDLIKILLFCGLALLLFLPPYFRGLHFPSEQEMALLFATILFLATFYWRWSKGDQSFLAQPLDYLTLALPLVYLASAFQAANTGLAIDEVVKTTLYFMVYWIVSRLVRDEQDIKNILLVIFLSAIGVALAGLTAATGIVYIHDAFFEGRMGSTFQYANALAGFLGAVIFIGLNLWVNADHTYKRYLYAAANLLLIAVFLGAKSQGGLLVFIIVTGLYLFGVPKGFRLKVLTHLLPTFIVAYFTIKQFVFFARAYQTGLAWLCLLAGLLAVILLQYIFDHTQISIKDIDLLKGLKNKPKISVIILLLALGAAALIVSLHPDGRVLLVNIKLHSAADRMFYAGDALKMFQDRPWLGWGGGGWREAYHSYQSFFYISNQVHNYYIQVLVETGLLGLLVVAGIWAAFLIRAGARFLKVKNTVGPRMLVWTLTMSAIYLGMHALIDFDLSLAAIALILWVIFGMMSGLGDMEAYRGQEPTISAVRADKIIKMRLLAACVTLLAITVVLMDLRLYCGTMQMRQALQYVINSDARAVPLLEKAICYDPWNADYHNTLASIYQQSGKFSESVTECQRTIALSQYNPQYYGDLAEVYLAMKDYKNAVACSEKAIKFSPYALEWYEFKANTCLNAGLSCLEQGDSEAARKYLLLTLEVPSQIEKQMMALDENKKKRWVDRPLMIVTPAIRLDKGTAYCFLGQFKQAESNLSLALKEKNTKDKAALILAVMRTKQGRDEEARVFLDQVRSVNPELGKSYDGLCKLQIRS